MNDRSLDDLIAAANPADPTAIAELELTSARDELMNGVMAVDAPARAGRTAPSPSRWRFRVLGIAAAAVCAAVVAVLLIGSGSNPTSSDSAWAAEQVRFAEASPLVLLDLPGWKVSYATEETPIEGEMSFFYAPDKKISRLTDPALHWRKGPISDWYEDRASSAEWQSTAPVLGTTARVYEYADGPSTMLSLTAIWPQEGRVLEFRSQVPDREAFFEQLDALTKVDVDQWLSALPKRSIPMADRSSAIAKMLEGVPLPPGFDPTEIRGSDLTLDTTQLGNYVSGTVACLWMSRWADARAHGDEREEKRAFDAMATVRSWPTANGLMARVADAMPEGTFLGEPLDTQINQLLGCKYLGVDLRNP